MFDKLAEYIYQKVSQDENLKEATRFHLPIFDPSQLIQWANWLDKFRILIVTMPERADRRTDSRLEALAEELGEFYDFISEMSRRTNPTENFLFWVEGLWVFCYNKVVECKIKSWNVK